MSNDFFPYSCRVPARKKSEKMEVKGIFPDATVVHGPDWQRDRLNGKLNLLALHLSAQRRRAIDVHLTLTLLH
jgi:hypothetical protein